MLGKRSDIAAQQDKFLNTIYTYHDLCDEASEKLTAVLNIQRELEDFSEFDPQYYQGELNTLKLDTEELNSKLNQLQSNLERMRLEGMVEPLRETLKSTLELIAKLLVVLRVNPSSSIKINSQPFGLSPKGPTRKRKLVKTDGSEVP